jgi:hypothetical protein
LFNAVFNEAAFHYKLSIMQSKLRGMMVAAPESLGGLERLHLLQNLSQFQLLVLG